MDKRTLLPAQFLNNVVICAIIPRLAMNYITIVSIYVYMYC